MSSKLNTTYYGIKSEGHLLCGYNSQTNGLYSTPGKAQSFIDRKMKRARSQTQIDEINTWKIVPVQIVEIFLK